MSFGGLQSKRFITPIRAIGKRKTSLEMDTMNMTGSFGGNVSKKLIEDARWRQLKMPGKIGQDPRFRSTMRMGGSI